MLECILIAGTLFFHAAHSEERGVRLLSVWEFVIPVEDTSLAAGTDLIGEDDADKSEHAIHFYRTGHSFTIYLDKRLFPDFSMVAFMKTCPPS